MHVSASDIVRNLLLQQVHDFETCDRERWCRCAGALASDVFAEARTQSKKRCAGPCCANSTASTLEVSNCGRKTSDVVSEYGLASSSQGSAVSIGDSSASTRHGQASVADLSAVPHVCDTTALAARQKHFQLAGARCGNETTSQHAGISSRHAQTQARRWHQCRVHT